MRRMVIFTILSLYAVIASAGEITVTQLSGGSNKIELGYNFNVNDGSSLERVYYVINDSDAPMTLVETGIRAEYIVENYLFRTTGSILSNADIAAFRIVFVLFDFFGEHMRGLAYQRATDIPAGAELDLTELDLTELDLKGDLSVDLLSGLMSDLSGSWNASERDVSDYLTSVVFLDKVRRADGTIWTADHRLISQQIEDLPLVGGKDVLTVE